MFDNFFERFNRIFIEGEAYLLLIDGLKYTLIISIIAVMIGILLGILLAVCKVIPHKNIFTKFLNGFASVYITIIRGTPIMVQLLLFYFGIFATTWRDFEYRALVIAILVFGINSSAYVAEIIRSGILSIDKGQMEAARSLGMRKSTAMVLIVIPQAIKNILPAIGNEFVAIIKESSMASIIGVNELMFAGKVVSGSTYLGLEPYIVAAGFYFIMTFTLGRIISLIERRMKKSDSR